METATSIHALRQAVATFQPSIHPRSEAPIAFGAKRVDDVLKGGLARGALHEIVPAGSSSVPAAIGLVAGLCRRIGSAGEGKIGESRQRGRQVDILWLRQRHSETESGKLYPCGLREIGFDPETLILVRLSDVTSLLMAAMEAAGCHGLGMLVIEFSGDPAVLDLTATRKLALLAEKSGVSIFCLRAMPQRGSSSAMTRWQVAPAPSRALQANAPGQPAFNLKLLRHRMGPAGLAWRLEWNRDEKRFEEAPLSGAVVSLPAHRPVAQEGTIPWRRTG